MKKVIEKEVEFCDACGKEGDVKACLNCGVEHCWYCNVKLGVRYSHGVRTSGSGEGYYCQRCDILLHETKSDPIYCAYAAIQQLRREYEDYYADWKRRAEKAEAHLRQLQEL